MVNGDNGTAHILMVKSSSVALVAHFRIEEQNRYLINKYRPKYTDPNPPGSPISFTNPQIVAAINLEKVVVFSQNWYCTIQTDSNTNSAVENDKNCEVMAKINAITGDA